MTIDSNLYLERIKSRNERAKKVSEKRYVYKKTHFESQLVRSHERYNQLKVLYPEKADLACKFSDLKVIREFISR